ncbi:MAG: MOSC N-terminal beta barrel domain-containing protein, partial [Bacteroidota bacterium]
MPTVRELYIYPVKSLAGIRVEDAELTDRGFQYDRRWMLIDENNVFLSQREHSQMALLQTAITENGIQVFAKNDKTISTLIPFEPEMIETTTVKIWDEFCHAIGVSDKTDQWFSEILGIKCRLVYMADKVIRKVDKRYALSENDIASFADAYPLLIISQESLQDLNSRMTQPLSMNRFRPNIVLDGVEPYEEDVMEEFAINGINFFGVKLCARC